MFLFLSEKEQSICIVIQKNLSFVCSVFFHLQWLDSSAFDAMENSWSNTVVRGLNGAQSLGKEEQEGVTGVHVKVFVIFNMTPHKQQQACSRRPVRHAPEIDILVEH